MTAPTPLSEDAIGRFRLIHPDKESRPLARRLHRYAASSSSDPASDSTDADHEREMIRLEALKWKLGVERMLGSVKNLERQRSSYLARAEETVNKTAALRQTLEEEKILLAIRRRERDRMIKCDEIAAKITARGKNRQELDERIATVQQSLEEHQAALKVYQETAQGRIDIFNQISELVKNCRDLRLPIDPNATVPVEEDTADKKDSVDEPSASSSSGSRTAAGPKLSSMALPFQPTAPSGSGPSSSSVNRSSKARSSTPPSSAALPPRPPTGPSSSSASRVPSRPSGASSLPARPSNLRSSTTTGQAQVSQSMSSLEEGEVGGDEDGEVKERGTKRALEPERTSSRSTRSRK